MKNLLLFIALVACAAVSLYLAMTPASRLPVQNIDVVVPSVPTNPETSAPVTPTEPNVVEALKPIFRVAASTNKKVLVLVSMDNCVWCDKLKREVFPNVDMSSIAFLETKDSTVSNTYGVHSFPTCILFDNTGKELKRIVGYKNTPQFNYWLNAPVLNP